MSTDPISLLSTGSIAASTYNTDGTIGKPSATSPSKTTTSSSTASEPASTASSPATGSAFILDANLAKLISRGASGLTGGNLSGYNSQALALQGNASLVSNMPTGDTLTSDLVGQSTNYAMLRELHTLAPASATPGSTSTTTSSSKTTIDGTTQTDAVIAANTASTTNSSSTQDSALTHVLDVANSANASTTPTSDPSLAYLIKTSHAIFGGSASS